jgi:transposase
MENAMRNSYSPEFKAKVVREVLREDKTLSQVAAAHGLHPNLVSQWRDQALNGMAGLFSRAKESDWAAKEAAILSEAGPSHNWGSGSPLPSVPADNFSARWTSIQGLNSGNYVLQVRAARRGPLLGNGRPGECHERFWRIPCPTFAHHPFAFG